MMKRVRVCGAAVAISMDTERDLTCVTCGWVLMMTEDFVVLREGENTLRVVDTQAFCSGSIEVRHVVELPSNITISRRIQDAKYGVAWSNGQYNDTPVLPSVYIIDFQTGDVFSEECSVSNEVIADAFVNSSGRLFAVVGGAAQYLYGRDQYNGAEWIKVDMTELNSQTVDSCSSGQFVSSVVMGSCFVYLRAIFYSNGSIDVEKWIFDVDSGWTIVSFSSKTLEISASDANSADNLKLLVNQDSWKFAILIVGNVLYHFQVDSDLRSSVVKRISLDHRAVSGIWIEQDVAFAILLANGQVCVAYPYMDHFELLVITTSNALSERLNISTLLGKAVPTALQLAWIKQENQLAVDFGSSCAAIKLEIVDAEVSFCPPADPKFHSAFASIQGKRGELASLKEMFSCYHEHSSAKESATSTDRLNTARFTIARGQYPFENAYFTLLIAIHEQLAAVSLNNGKSQDPIDFISKQIKLMELLISLAVSLEPEILREIGLKLLSAGPTRKLHYHKEKAQIIYQVQRSLRGVSDLEDWWVESFEVKAFLRVYFSAVRALLHKINAEHALHHQRSVVQCKNIGALCQLVIDREKNPAETIFKADKGDNSLFHSLKRLLLSYTALCRYLGVNGVTLDMEHLFLIGTSASMRKEVFCCFLKPWQCLDDINGFSNYFESNYMSPAVIRNASSAGTLDHLLRFAMTSRSPRVHSFLQDIFKTITMESEAMPSVIIDVNTLHWQACEAYISEAMTIFRNLGTCKRFKYSNRESIFYSEHLTLPYQFDRTFDIYCRTILTKISGTSEMYFTGSKTSPLWEFSHLDQQLCDRVVFLIMRVVWHLEATTEKVTNLFKEAFALNAFDPQQNLLFAESETFDASILKMRTDLQFEPEFYRVRFSESEDSPEELSFRSKKIARSVMLLAWGLWIREKTAICARSIHIVKVRGDIDPHLNESVGASAATCALYLNALGALNCDSEELLNVQLALLEEASTMNANKVATIIAWGFPAHKIATRHLKRYKRLIKIIQDSSENLNLDECERQYEQLQIATRKAFFHVQCNQNGYEEPIFNGNNNTEIDVLVGCCCTGEFLQILSVLTKSNCEVVATNFLISRDLCISEDVQDETEKSRASLTSELFPSLGTEAGPTSIPTNEHTSIAESRMTESMISRDEVIELLKAHTRHLEDKINAVTATASDNHNRSKQFKDPPVIRTKQTDPICDGKAEKDASELTNVQVVERISLNVRDLNPQRKYSVSSENNLPPNTIQRHDSVRNVLKLFRLRQENSVHTRRDLTDLTDGSAVNEAAGLSTITKSRTTTPLPISATNASRQCCSRRTISQNQCGGVSETLPVKEPVYPLRLVYGTDHTSLQLLGRSSQQWNPSLKRRQFIHRERKSSDYRVKSKMTAFDEGCTDVLKLKTSSAQTNATKGRQKPRNQSDDSSPEKSSPMTQKYDEDTCTTVASIPDIAREAIYRKGVGIQCCVTEDSLTNSARRKHGPPLLNIADKYPVWIDLDGRSNCDNGNQFKDRKKFLQVAGFGRDDTTTDTPNNDLLEENMYFNRECGISTVSVTRHSNSDEENQSESQHSPIRDNIEVLNEHFTEQSADSMKVKFRARYRQHFSVRERIGRINDNRDRSSGIETLIDLRDNMQQMTHRLRVLETCANSIDNEFKVSQKKLSRIEHARLDGVSPRSKVLIDVAEVLKATKNAGNKANGRNAKMGLLAKKASNDLNAAKALMETIEQLTISVDDS